MRCRAWQGVLEGSGDLVTRVINKLAIVTDFFAPTKELRILLTRSHDPAKYVLGIRVSEVHHPLVANAQHRKETIQGLRLKFSRRKPASIAEGPLYPEALNPQTLRPLQNSNASLEKLKEGSRP